MRTAIITGVTSGIGFATALQFAGAGYRVVGIGRRPEGFTELRRRIADPDRHLDYRFDLRDTHRIAGLVAEIGRAVGPIDVLVNNAGRGLFAPLRDTDPATCAEVIAVNLLAPIELTRQVLPLMVRAGGGTIVNVVSVAGKRSWKHLTAYSASKFGLLGFSTSLRRELAHERLPIRVSVVCPPAVRTDFFANAGYPDYERDHPRATLVDPAVVAEAIVRLSRTRKREVIVSARARCLDLLARCSPSFTEWLEDAVARRR